MIASEYKLYSNLNLNSNYESIRLYNSLVLPQTRYLRKHYHTSIEISFFKQGCGFYKTKGHIYEIKTGDIFFFSTNEEHYITEILEPDEMHIMNIHIDPRFIWMCENIISSRRVMEIFFNREKTFENRFSADSPITKYIANLMLKIEREFIEQKDSFETIIKLHIFEVLTCFIRHFGPEKENAKTYPLTYEKFLYINRAIDYIENHFSEPLTLEKLSQIAGFSQTYFGTLFKRMMGLSPWDYINLKRINHARELLTTTNMTIDCISHESGFNNTTLFNRLFKKTIGLTPSEVRSHTP